MKAPTKEHRRFTLSLVLALLLIAALAPNVVAIEVEVEFLGDSFFSQNAQAIAAIEAASDHVSAAITSTLAPVDEVNFAATVGNTTATLDWGYSFRDPFTNQPIGNLPTTVPNPTLAANRVRIFVDAQPLNGTIVGQGVPSGAEANIGATILGPGPLNGDAIQSVAALADAEMNRGGDGALIGQLFEGPDNLGGVDVNAIRFRTAFGGVAFDNDSDDNDLLDTAQQLQDFWHLDHTTAVDANKIDLFSVAVSEIVTAIGFGTSDAFEALASGRDWAGAEVVDLLGTGEDVLDPIATGNILAGTLSTRISDGAVQQAALDPNIQAGVREELTALDLAFLRDIGFQTIVPPSTLAGDFDTDGDVDGDDFLVWQRGGSPVPLSDTDLTQWQNNHGTSSAASLSASAAPEPSTAILAITMFSTLGLARRRSKTI